MEDEEDLSPSGSDVVAPGVSGLGAFGTALGGLFLTGLSRRIDLEFAEREQIIDSATQTAFREQQQFREPAPRGLINNLTPLQIGGFLVAGALAVALVAGAFR